MKLQYELGIRNVEHELETSLVCGAFSHLTLFYSRLGSSQFTEFTLKLIRSTIT